MMRDRFVVGLLDDTLSGKLQLDVRVTETAVTTVHQSEEVRT